MRNSTQEGFNRLWPFCCCRYCHRSGIHCSRWGVSLGMVESKGWCSILLLFLKSTTFNKKHLSVIKPRMLNYLEYKDFSVSYNYLSKVGWSWSGAPSSLESWAFVVYKLEWLVLWERLLEFSVPVAAVE